MGGLALLARERNDIVSGSDEGVYPPMSTQLEQAGITLTTGFDANQLNDGHDIVLVGNALSRGNPCIERLLSEKRDLVSGPAWLAEHVLRERCVLAVAGTHGKTTTASMLAWILEQAGHDPGFLIGGVPRNFGVSARLGSGRYFVVEADEYDTAFFDKRSKFVHYRAHVMIVNNLEFDHADIFRDLDDIRRQFHHALRLVPREGHLVIADSDPALEQLVAMGVYSNLHRFAHQAGRWQFTPVARDVSRFEISDEGRVVGEVSWDLIGQHNALNALAAIVAAQTVGVSVAQSTRALATFAPPRRRLEQLARINGITVYDDFAHHPTAIRASIEALRAHVGDEPIVAVLDPASNTMRMGVHRHTLAPALKGANRVLLHHGRTRPGDLESVCQELGPCASLHRDPQHIVDVLVSELAAPAHVLIMSNAGFGAMHRTLIHALETK